MDTEPSTSLLSIPFDFWSATIAALFGLISGTIASLIAPWVHYFIERRKKSSEYKAELIKETRKVIDRSQTMSEVKKSSLWGFIEENLTEEEKAKAMPVRTLVVQRDDGAQISQEDIKKQAVSRMLARLEKDWGLTK
ncbi:hypothetical protein [Guyparkeria halopsychrophila]|uniref:hypothetical protein n=1 Tax=Guyparkeria halopsychrophila TaxID=3139421 RepID=UPI0037C605D5